MPLSQSYECLDMGTGNLGLNHRATSADPRENNLNAEITQLQYEFQFEFKERDRQSATREIEYAFLTHLVMVLAETSRNSSKHYAMLMIQGQGGKKNRETCQAHF